MGIAITGETLTRADFSAYAAQLAMPAEVLAVA
jgi:hypothetical protein